MKLIVLNIFITVLIKTTTGYRTCFTPDYELGFCRDYTQCPKILELINRSYLSIEERIFLRSSRCSAQNELKFCCPLTHTPEKCYTPDGQDGICLRYEECPYIHNVDANFLQNSRCMSSRGTTEYCCGKHRPKPALPFRYCPLELTAFPPDPVTDCCGLDGVFQPRIFGGRPARLGQYPWLAIIKYAKPQRKEQCSGSLISSQYILTAAHCVYRGKKNRPVSIVLGENNKRCDPDCEYIMGIAHCADKIKNYGIEEIVVHPGFDPVDPNEKNDIALVRMDRPARYTKFIRPICLPTGTEDITETPPSNFVLWTAGWGNYDNMTEFSDVKLFVELPLVNITECRKFWTDHEVTDTQICAGGVSGKDTCYGDSGNPLMYNSGGRWQILGIVSYGPQPCGNGKPGVYTKVFEYNTWIRRNIRP